MAGTATSGGVPAYDAMLATLGDRDRRRAGRWLTRSGGLMPIPKEAGDLLAVRLAARNRVLWRVGGPLVAPVVALLVWWVWLLFRDGTGFEAVDRYGFPAAACHLAIDGWVLGTCLTRADTRIADALPLRVARERRAPVTVVLGRTATLWAVVALGSLLSFPLAALVLQPTWSTLLRMSAAVLVVGEVGIAVARQVRRDAVALDGFSLVVDERLRSEQARLDLSALPFALWACLPRGSSAGPALPVPLVAAGHITGLVLVLTSFILWRSGAWQSGRGRDWTVPVRLNDDHPGS